MENVFIVIRCGEEDNDVTIVDVCATEEIASATKENWEKENPDDDVWVEVWGVETEMPKKLKDIDCVSFLEHFKLKSSESDFILVDGPNDSKLIVNLSEGAAYTIDEISSGEFGIEFYTKDNNKTFKGVEVVENEDE